MNVHYVDSSDALDLATALERGVDDVVTFDRGQAEAAASVGLHALTPR